MGCVPYDQAVPFGRYYSVPDLFDKRFFFHFWSRRELGFFRIVYENIPFRIWAYFHNI